jgi:hypothetical protein
MLNEVKLNSEVCGCKLCHQIAYQPLICQNSHCSYLVCKVCCEDYELQGNCPMCHSSGLESRMDKVTPFI